MKVLNIADNFLGKGDVHEALKAVLLFALEISQDFRTVGRVFASPELDAFCQGVGRRVLAAMPDVESSVESGGRAGGRVRGPVYLATELYTAGGHTAVLEDFLKSGCFPGRATILLTHGWGRSEENSHSSSNEKDVRQRFAPYDVEIEAGPVPENFADQLVWALNRLRYLRPTHLFLFNHPHDSISIAAAQPSLADKIYFYHHNDHRFGLGTTLPYDFHIDLSPMVYHHCRNELNIKTNVYWPLTSEDYGAPSVHERTFTAGGALRTCSSGSEVKFQHGDYKYSYADILPRILNVTQGTHVHIGPMSKRMSNDLAQTMHEANISPDRLIHVPWVPSLWQAVQECEVDVYLNSFPLGGGRAIVELLGSGTPVIMHQNYRSRIFGTVDMAYPEAFSWRTPEELLEHLKSLTPDQVREEALLARRHYEETHTFADFRTRVLAGHQAPPAPPLREYTHDALQTFLEDIGAAG